MTTTHATVENLNDAQIKRARRELDKHPALRRRYDTLLETVKTLATHEARRKHIIGLAVVEMQDDANKYGKRSVATLAALLVVDRSTLNDYAQVARSWTTPRELAAVLREKNAVGVPVTFSHLVEISELTKKSERDRWLAKVRKSNLTVEQLRVALRGPRPENASSDEATQVRHEASRWRAQIDQMNRGTEWVIGRASKNPTKAVLDELKDFAALQRELATEAEKNAARLDQERERLSKKARASG